MNGDDDVQNEETVFSKTNTTELGRSFLNLQLAKESLSHGWLLGAQSTSAFSLWRKNEEENEGQSHFRQRIHSGVVERRDVELQTITFFPGTSCPTACYVAAKFFSTTNQINFPPPPPPDSVHSLLISFGCPLMTT